MDILSHPTRYILLPREICFLGLLRAMADAEPNALHIVDAEDWRLYLMDKSDVERELMRLHQFRKVHFGYLFWQESQE